MIFYSDCILFNWDFSLSLRFILVAYAKCMVHIIFTRQSWNIDIEIIGCKCFTQIRVSQNWSGSKVSYCEIADSLLISLRRIFLLLAQRPTSIRYVTTFLLFVIELTVNQSERFFPGTNLPPEHSYITFAAGESTKRFLQTWRMSTV